MLALPRELVWRVILHVVLQLEVGELQPDARDVEGVAGAGNRP